MALTEKNKQFIQKYFDALCRGNTKPRHVVDQFVSDQDYALKNHIEVFEAAFPSYALHMEDMIGEGDKVTVRFRFEGTHMGEFMGIPPSGKTATFEGIIIYQIEDEKIINHWINVDKAELIRQIQPEEAAVLM